MLILIIPLVFILLFLFIHGSPKDIDIRGVPWRRSLLITTAVFSVLLVVISESLSLFTVLNQVYVATTWTLISLIVILWGVNNGSIARGWTRLDVRQKINGRYERVILIAMASLVIILSVIIVIAPSNNIDVITYHMPRVLHWIQNQSLDYFPASDDGQNKKPYFAEAVILHLRILWGDDRIVGFVQLFFMIASVVTVTEIARLLNVKMRGQWLTAVFAFTIPMGLLQSVTALNDYVSAFWILCLTTFTLGGRDVDNSRFLDMAISLSLGLGMLTKGTYFPYAAPLVVWIFSMKFFRQGFMSTMKLGFLSVLVVAAINGPFWQRNIAAYGGPYGAEIPVNVGAPSFNDDLAIVQNEHQFASKYGENLEIQKAGVKFPFGLSQEWVKESGWWGFLKYHFGRTLQMLALNFVTPIYYVNQQYFRFLEILGGPFTPQYIGSLREIVWNHEHLAGNPLHMGLVLIGVIYTAQSAVRNRMRTLIVYTLAMLTGFALLSLIDYATVIYSIRYQLAFLLMGAPLVARVMDRYLGSAMLKVVMSLFLIYGLPYVFLSNLRPIIGMPPWPTKTDSILVEDPNKVLFALSPNLQDEYEILTQVVKDSSCHQVGLDIHKEALEYAFWWLLDAPQSGVTLKLVSATAPLDRYLDPEYKPCAILCTRCAERDSYDDMPLAVDAGHVRLYASFDDAR